MRAFPLGAPTKRLSCTAASANIAVPTPVGGALFENVRAVNHGPYAGFLRPGTSVGVAAAVPTGTESQDTPVLPGEDVVFSLPAGTTHIAGICASGGTATIDLSFAEGW